MDGAEAEAEDRGEGKGEGTCPEDYFAEICKVLRHATRRTPREMTGGGWHTRQTMMEKQNPPDKTGRGQRPWSARSNMFGVEERQDPARRESDARRPVIAGAGNVILIRRC